MLSEHQAIHSLSARIEQIVGLFGGKCDVSDEGKAGKALLQDTDALEVRFAAGEQVDHCHADGLLLADAEHLRPIVACHDLVAIPNSGSESLQVHRVREEGGDDAHAAPLWLLCGESS